MTYSDSQINDWIHSVGGGIEKTYIAADLEQDLLRQAQQAETPDARQAAQTDLLAWHAAYLASLAADVVHSVRGGDNLDILDVLQEGVVRFFEKIETYDLDQTVRLTTWYSRDVKTTMQRFANDTSFPVRQGSVFLQSVAYRVTKFVESYHTQHATEPTITQIADDVGESEATVADALEYTKINTTEIPEIFGSNDTTDSPPHPIDEILTLLEHKLDALTFSERQLVTTYAIQNGVELPPDLQFKLKYLEVLRHD